MLTLKQTRFDHTSSNSPPNMNNFHSETSLIRHYRVNMFRPIIVNRVLEEPLKPALVSALALFQTCHLPFGVVPESPKTTRFVTFGNQSLGWLLLGVGGRGLDNFWCLIVLLNFLYFRDQKLFKIMLVLVLFPK